VRHLLRVELLHAASRQVSSALQCLECRCSGPTASTAPDSVCGGPTWGRCTDHVPDEIDFFEVAPENWLGVGGRIGDAFARISASARCCVTACCSISAAPTRWTSPSSNASRAFLGQHRAVIYGDHLSFCAAGGQLYELLPIPFTAEAVHHVAARIREVQERLEQRASPSRTRPTTCACPTNSTSRPSSTRCWRKPTASCSSTSTTFTSTASITATTPRPSWPACPASASPTRISPVITRTDDGLIVDTHGTPIVEPVWDLLDFAYRQFGVFPTLLERDENIPPLAELLPELRRIRAAQQHPADSGDGLAA
jgi:hypothetical protein